MEKTKWALICTVGMMSATCGWCGGVPGKMDLTILGASTNATNIEVDGKPIGDSKGSVPVEFNAEHKFRWAEPVDRTIMVAAAEGFDRLVPPAVWQTNLAAVQASYGGYKLAVGTAESASLSMALPMAIAAARGSLAGTDEKNPMTNRTDLLEWRIVPSTKGVGVACLVGMVAGAEVSVPSDATKAGPIPPWVFAPSRALSEHKEMGRITIGVGEGRLAHQRAMTAATAEMAPGAVTTSSFDRPGVASRRVEMRTSGVVSGARPLATWEMVFEGQYVVFVLAGSSSPVPVPQKSPPTP